MQFSSLETILTIVSYLVFITAYIVRIRGDLVSLEKRFDKFHDNHSDFHTAFDKLREDFVRLETKIEVLLKSTTK